MTRIYHLLDSAVPTEPPSTVDIDVLVAELRAASRRRWIGLNVAAGLTAGVLALVAAVMTDTAAGLPAASPADTATPEVIAAPADGQLLDRLTAQVNAALHAMAPTLTANLSSTVSVGPSTGVVYLIQGTLQLGQQRGQLVINMTDATDPLSCTVVDPATGVSRQPWPHCAMTAQNGVLIRSRPEQYGVQVPRRSCTTSWRPSGPTAPRYSSTSTTTSVHWTTTASPTCHRH